MKSEKLNELLEIHWVIWKADGYNTPFILQPGCKMKFTNSLYEDLSSRYKDECIYFVNINNESSPQGLYDLYKSNDETNTELLSELLEGLDKDYKMDTDVFMSKLEKIYTDE